MPFVLDASITLSWSFSDEGHPHAALAEKRLQTDPAVVPSLWWLEIRNALLMNERRGRLTEAKTAAFLRFLSGLPITLDRAPSEAEVLRLARTHRLTVYDACYLELAQRNGTVLATLDADLIRAAKAEAVPLIGEVS
ncbi:type II toxin-antitoxin system VapC family toxin [Paracidobacterium acidisoli]|uniref:PIN domain-containing protein n=1 Tax=Paracidobacterium acidisoli TaxID=2303751 RepID=A0A372IQN0_9BACT|nr:type II toxin-antitoxin system VapC family toxin [Paracidobacterium acidisoli]MBT9331142.1 type II toxin-antitoxin system VapC family toxin [Paracidobacterium acidisoli]